MHKWTFVAIVLAHVAGCGEETEIWKDCTDSDECAGDAVCYEGWGNGIAYCTEDCTGKSGGDACGNSGVCLIEGGDDNICLPTCETLSDCTAINDLFTKCEVNSNDAGGAKICSI